MAEVRCSLCKERICKYEQDWSSTGAIVIDRGNKTVKKFDICHECGVEITKEMVDQL